MKFKALLSATLLAAAVAVEAGSGRTVVPFQYAWRFHYGDDPSSPPGSGPGTAVWEEDLADYNLCDGMEHNPNRFSPKDCRIACSYDPNCLVWQGFPIAYGRACYHGYTGMTVNCTKDPKKPSHMEGGRRSKSPTPAFRTNYSFATAEATSDIDADWDVVDAPHDFISEYANFTNDITNFKQGYLPRNASWYRKHFTLPQDWATSGSTFVRFEGVFHHTTVFLNGHYLMQHDSGYTGFDVRLDNATNVHFGDTENVLTIRADATFGSGHWYEGGGIYRPVSLIHVAPTHIVRDGLFVPPGSTTKIVASAEIEGTSPASVTASVTFTLLSQGGKTIATATSEHVTVPEPGKTVIASATIVPQAGAVQEWSIQNPTLYQVRADVNVGINTMASVTTTVGFRTTTWTAGENGESPFSLNGKGFHFRGFSHHNSIGGLGVAIPQRINLFRVQASRALGSNIWRMSHNPYTEQLYDLLDATGMLTWDENRDYGAKYGGGLYVRGMHEMVKAHRNHPSIVIWSFCNEFECGQNDAVFSGNAYRNAALSADPTRPLTANGPANPDSLDVQGFSHSKNNTFEAWHSKNKTEPLVLSECCRQVLCIAKMLQRT